MTSVVVVLSTPREVAGLPGNAVVEPASNEDAVADILRSHDAAVLVSDGFPREREAALADTIRASGKRVIEVRAARWDGETPSPVSGACQGVISGFGDAGIIVAVRICAVH